MTAVPDAGKQGSGGRGSTTTTVPQKQWPYLGGLKDRDASKRRLGKEFRRFAVARVVELRHFQLHTVVFRGDQDLKGAEVRGVCPKLLLCRWWGQEGRGTVQNFGERANALRVRCWLLFSHPHTHHTTISFTHPAQNIHKKRRRTRRPEKPTNSSLVCAHGRGNQRSGSGLQQRAMTHKHTQTPASLSIATSNPEHTAH